MGLLIVVGLLVAQGCAALLCTREAFRTSQRFTSSGLSYGFLKERRKIVFYK